MLLGSELGIKYNTSYLISLKTSHPYVGILRLSMSLGGAMEISETQELKLLYV
jgi:hypothetical protein